MKLVCFVCFRRNLGTVLACQAAQLHLGFMLHSHLGRVATLVRRILRAEPSPPYGAWQEVARWFRPKSVIEASASMAKIIKPPNCTTVADLQRAIMEWELQIVEHKGGFNEHILESLKVAALRTHVDSGDLVSTSGSATTLSTQ